VTVHSPAGISATHRGTEPLAHIVDRAELDRTLAARAQDAGVTFLLSTQAVEVTRDSHGIKVSCRRPGGKLRSLSASMVILAGGPRFAFHERLGLGTSSVLWQSAHAELPGNGLPHAQVYLGRDVTPGAFGWAVPVERSGKPYVRIGVNGHSDAPRYLRKLCEEKFPHLYGMLSAQDAADTVLEVFKRGTFTRHGLSAYEKRWRARLGFELKVGTLFRRLFARMTDRDVDEFFRTLCTDGLLARITERVSFDWHRELILFLLKHPKLSRILMRRCLDWRAKPRFSDLSTR
jgi:digeranylgeranylglycerophospholipid reductase